MVVEISVAVIAAAFVVLVIFTIIALVQAKRTLKKAEKTSESATHLAAHLNELTIDIKKKSEAIDMLFRPIYGLKREKADHGPETKFDAVAEIVQALAKAAVMIHKLRGGSK